ncbi:MAG: TIGR01212 family radical SAM protein [Chitinivibrionales bacterium]|nr:TIGR01212 family radical SAM protein [Chitinivibrionales bacterium]
MSNFVEHYNSYRSYLKERFSTPVLKVPINGGFSCPNRDGTISREGCLFCDNRSFSPAAQNIDSPLEQLKNSIARAEKYSAILPYLQPFTNTYGSVEYLKSVYEPLICLPKVVGLAIGTRPDCFNEEIYSYLKDLETRTYLNVELGLQSSHPETLRRINRGHGWDEFVKCVNELASKNIETVAHIIIGLPGETPDMIYTTARKLASLPLTGIKIHQLMIIKGTPFESWYISGKAVPLSLPAYAKLVGEVISFLNPKQHIHRVLADSRPEYGLIAPLWSAEKLKSLNYIRSYMDKNSIVQGSKFPRS